MPEVEASLQALYDAVAPVGHLVITDHNRYAQSLFAIYAQDPHEHFGSDSGFDPDTFADRFELVIDGESLLSYAQTQERLDTCPQSVWSVIPAEPYDAWKQNPLVSVPN